MSDSATGDLVGLVAEQERLRQVAGQYEGFQEQPGLAASLAASGASHGDIAAVGGFAKGLQLSQRVMLARQSGILLDLSDEDRGLLAAVGTHYDDVDRSTRQVDEQWHSEPGLLGRVGNVVNRATQIPGVRHVFAGLDRVADIANTGYRVYSQQNAMTAAAFGSSEPYASDLAETARGMEANGYGSDFLGAMAFASRGKLNFRNLDDLRQEYNPEQVDLAQRYLIDPEGFMAGGRNSVDELIKRDKLMRDPAFERLVSEVDARHISPGRDLANGLGLQPGTTPYTAVSGSADAVWSIYADPTLVLGKVNAGVKIARYGLNTLSDVGRIEALMRGNERISRGFALLMEDAHTMRRGSAEGATLEDKAAAAGAYARARARTPELMGLVPEINGVGPIRNGKTIDDYEELITHVSGHGALLRMRNGLAAREAPLMPGAVSAYGYRAIKANLAGRAIERGVRVLDLEKDAAKIVPSSVDAYDLEGMDATGLVNSKEVAAAASAYRKTMRGRAATLARRMTLLPEHISINLADASGAEDIRRFANLYMPQSHANALAARYAVATLGERRAIAEAAYDQVIHTAGIPSTTGGRAWLEAQKKKRALEKNSAYDASGQQRDLILGADGEPTRREGLYSTQTNDRFRLADPVELRRVAAKVGIYEHTLGHGLEAGAVDTVMNSVRTSWLIQPASALRQSLEAVLAAQAQGVSLPSLVRARGHLSSDLGRRAEQRLRNVVLYEVDGKYKKLTRTIPGVFHGRVMSKVRHAEHALGKRFGDAELQRRATEMVDAEMSGELSDLAALNGSQATRGAWAGEEAQSILDRGYKAAKVSFRHREGYHLDSADGYGGARFWSQEFGRRMTSAEGRHVLRAALEDTPYKFREGPTFEKMAGWARSMGVKIPRSWIKKEEREAVRLMYRTFFPDEFPGPARGRLVDFMLSKDFRDQRAKMERFSVLRDGTRVGGDDALLRRAAEELADDQIADMTALITGRNGKIHADTVRRLKAGHVPSVETLSNVPSAERPAQVIQPKFVPDLAGDGNLRANVVQSLADKGYEIAVARPMAWLSTHPIFYRNYVTAYRNVEPEIRRLNPGMDDATIESLTRDSARMHAMDATVQSIDNPAVRSQMALVTRNMFNFWRAQEDFLRRWGRTLKENPAYLRKMQLYVEGGMHSGMIYEDQNGDLIFAYPGSGYAIKAVAKAMSAIGLGDYAGIGTVPNLTTKLQFMNSGIDRPFLPTTSPVASLPLRGIRHLWSDQAWPVELQRITEGEISSGRNWWAQALPSPVYRIMASQSTDEREGQYASAVKNAMLNAYAAGLVPGSEPGRKPEDPPPTPDELDAFRQRIKLGVRNHLAARAVLGLVLPGAPSNPTEETEASSASDLAKDAFNTTSLRGEFQGMVAEYGHPQALAVWAESHPDDLIYTISTTEGKGGTGGYLAPTDGVLRWLKDNPELVEKYPSLTAYFAPEGPGDFSADAWSVELELGLRQHKDLDTFYRDIVVKNAETTYFKMRDKRDAKAGAATAGGDDEESKRLKDSFGAWSTEWLKKNPLLQQKWAIGQGNTARLASLVSEVEGLASDPGLAAKFDPNGDLGRLVRAYRRKESWDGMHKGRTNDDVATRSAVDEDYTSYVGEILGRSPHLLPIYRGIFDKVD